MLNKLLIIALTLSVSAGITPKKLGKTMYKSIKTQNIKAVEDLFLSKNDFLELMQNMDPKPRQEQIDMMLENYDDRRQKFLDTYFDGVKGYNISKMKLKEITYDYHIGKPGSDEKINWPESKKHNPVYSTKSLTKIKYSLHLEDREDTHIIQFELMNYKNQWKLINIMRQPYIQ